MPELKIDVGTNKARSNHLKLNNEHISETYYKPELNIPGTQKRRMNESQIKMQDKAGFKKFLNKLK